MIQKMTLTETITHNMKLLRKERGHTVRWVAEQIGIMDARYRTYEYGQARAPLEIIMALSELYDVPIEKFLTCPE